MNPKILVADDDDRIRKMIRISLNASHYEVIESATIQETILKAAKNSPDLILLDLQFPDGNGITALREIRSWSETPVIVLSVLASDPEKISLLDGGADDYITKPFSMGELLARIRVALRNKTQDPGSPIFISGNLYVDLSNRNVKVSGITGTFDSDRIYIFDLFNSTRRKGINTGTDYTSRLGAFCKKRIRVFESSRSKFKKKNRIGSLQSRVTFDGARGRL